MGDSRTLCRKERRAQSRLLRDLRPEHPAKAARRGWGKEGPLKDSWLSVIPPARPALEAHERERMHPGPVYGRAGGIV
jgi:hypothetical protein